ncbi:uncharacterized protein G2W53_006480 [Senna tora]|uniref:Uncharacterized protein n=1 Tax=Senna tora TaxID=362788 RepID=A0A834X3Q9_9FABA|nr:uncharacterized protein G2W53_006480 [Senna tora]
MVFRSAEPFNSPVKIGVASKRSTSMQNGIGFEIAAKTVASHAPDSAIRAIFQACVNIDLDEREGWRLHI